MWGLHGATRIIARVLLVAAWLVFAGFHALFIAGFVFSWMKPQQAALLAYVMALLAIFAMPSRRLRDVAALLVALLTLPEFASAAASHHFDVTRWLLEIAFVAAALLPIVLDRLRRRAAQVGRISFHAADSWRPAGADGFAGEPHPPVTHHEG